MSPRKSFEWKAKFIALAQGRPGRIETRVARGFVLRPKIPIWVYFGGPWKGKCIFYGSLV
jgi:hypothetical protein